MTMAFRLMQVKLMAKKNRSLELSRTKFGVNIYLEIMGVIQLVKD